jgi:hypothetical protein
MDSPEAIQVKPAKMVNINILKTFCAAEKEYLRVGSIGLSKEDGKMLK